MGALSDGILAKAVAEPKQGYDGCLMLQCDAGVA